MNLDVMNFSEQGNAIDTISVSDDVLFIKCIGRFGKKSEIMFSNMQSATNITKLIGQQMIGQQIIGFEKVAGGWMLHVANPSVDSVLITAGGMHRESH